MDVIKQEKEYDGLVKRTNLVKLGRLAFSTDRMMDGVSETHKFIKRYLLLNGIAPAMYIPSSLKAEGQGEFYIDNLKRLCLDAHIEDLDNFVKTTCE